jgi:putative ABC transport system permease protein
MFKNYLKIAWRNLWKNKGYSALNIFGLAIGITCASLILLWVADELSFDTVFPKQETVYYLPTNQKYEGEWATYYSTPMLLARDLKQEIPEINRAVATSSRNLLFTEGENGINRNGMYADTDFFDIFSLQFIEGSKENAFTRPDAIVLTQKTAADLFGENVQVMNKTLRVNNTDNYHITGVVKDLPVNVSFGFNWLAPFERYSTGVEWMQEYGSNFTDTFVELAPGADFTEVNEKVKKMLPSKTENLDTYAFLHSIKDWHLRSHFEDGKIVGGQIFYVRMFLIIALIMLFIACINFMNLSTARSEKRAKEVGVRKVLGSNKNRLITQFMTEALLTAMLSAVISIILLLLLLPQFNIMVGKELAFRLWEPVHIGTMLGITFICGLLAGWYPAFFLSAFKPIEVINGMKSKKSGAVVLRKSLVVAQFVVSIIFIVSTIVVYQQIQHVKGRDIGYDKENLIKIPVNGDVVMNFNPIRNDMIASGLVENVALNNSNILSDGNNGSGFEWKGGTDTEDVLISFRHITPNFFETTGMQIIEGRGFGEDVARDSSNILISETFARMMGTESPVGKIVTRGQPLTVIGVVKDYLYGDMYNTSGPVMYFHNPDYANFMYVKTKSNASGTTALAAMERVMKRHNPAFPFEYEFVNDAFNAKFKSEKLLSDLSKVFAFLAIMISCLGLFGLAAYTAEQRKKEIGVRKVLGSTVSGIVTLLSKEFMQLVLIALLLAGPLAWWAMNTWLEGFDYHIEINIWVFVIAGLAAICIALMTVSFQAVKAAIANPVKSLRAE